MRGLVVAAFVIALGSAVGVPAWRAGTQRAASLGEMAAALPRLDLAGDMAGDMAGDGYAGSDTCQACHPGQYASWHASFHRTMTQAATPANVIGDFDDVDLEVDGWTCHLFRRGDEFWADMVDPEWERDLYRRDVDPRRMPDPPRVQRRIVMTTGAHHYQSYWVPGGDDRMLISFPFAWLRREQRWIPRRAAFMRPPEAIWAPQVWNATCINCHSVAGEPVEGQKGRFDTSVAELGIACEACHGPAAEHVRANRNPARRYRLHLEGRGDPTIVNPAKLPPQTSSQICGRCHSVSLKRVRAFDSGQRYRPGDDLNETHWVVRRSPRFLDDTARARHDMFNQRYAARDPGYFEGRFWPDGMVRVSGREYSAMIESACYQAGGLSCLACHSMHESDPDDQLAEGMQTDRACLQCHVSLAGGITEHTHHAAASQGSRCYNCHMPHTNYGLLKAIRSHLIDSPSVAASVQTGRPNACNLCHLDRTLEWTQEHLASWYGTAPVELEGDQRDVAASLLWLLSGDAGQRAISAWSMGWAPAQEASGRGWEAPYLAELLDDPYDAVRFIADRSLQTLPAAPADEALMRRLLSQRDDRVVDLKE